MIQAKIGKNLLVLMAKKNIRTISELQRRTGISRVTLSKIINGRCEGISLNTVIKICKGLECEINDLVNISKVS